jgi:hypothetical protein
MLNILAMQVLKGLKIIKRKRKIQKRENKKRIRGEESLLSEAFDCDIYLVFFLVLFLF